MEKLRTRHRPQMPGQTTARNHSEFTLVVTSMGRNSPSIRVCNSLTCWSVNSGSIACVPALKELEKPITAATSAFGKTLKLPLRLQVMKSSRARRVGFAFP